MIQRVLFGERAELARLRRAAFVEGARAAIPSLVATGAWGLVTGVAMVRTGLTEWQAIGMSLFVFAGSAQLAALPLIAADAPIWVILLTALVLNLRFVIFSAGLFPYLRRLPLKKRMVLGYLTADFGFAVSMQRWQEWRREAGEDERGSTRQLWFLAGVTGSTWLVWQAMSIAGITLGAQVPTTWGLDFLPIVSLIALTVPMINGKPALVGVIVAATVAVLAAPLPLRLGLLAAVLVGVAAAMAAEIALERKTEPQ
jgi:predicted branched-subunit amino acid permease